MAVEYLVENWTEPIDATLIMDVLQDATTGERAFEAVDLSGCSLAIKLYDADGTAVTPTGTAAIVTAATGKVRYSPGAAELVHSKSPYTVRWEVTDGSSKKSYFPNSIPGDQWVVSKP